MDELDRNALIEEAIVADGFEDDGSECRSYETGDFVRAEAGWVSGLGRVRFKALDITRVLDEHLRDDLMEVGVVNCICAKEGGALTSRLIERVEKERFDLKPAGGRSHLSNTLAEVKQKR